MKKFVPIAFLAVLCFAGHVKASQLTVNNTSTSPGQYTDLQTAINAAKAGDTILVSGSGTDYAINYSNGEVIISKKITLFGTGYNPIKDVPTTSYINQIHLEAGSAGTVIEGFHVLLYIYSDGGSGINNIVIRRNIIGDGTINGTINLLGDNWLVAENVIYCNANINGSNTIIENNLINTGYAGGSFGNTSGNTNLIFYNNVVADAPNINFYNATVYNNIFYNYANTNFTYFSGSSNCSFKNNIDYNNANTNPFNIGANSNTGSGNKLNTDPLFTNVSIDAYDNNNNFINYSSNLALKATSPGHLAGTDGKDIGLYGGIVAQNPLTGVPPIPQISTMDIVNNIVAPGGVLSVKIKAKSSN